MGNSSLVEFLGGNSALQVLEVNVLTVLQLQILSRHHKTAVNGLVVELMTNDLGHSILSAIFGIEIDDGITQTVLESLVTLNLESLNLLSVNFEFLENLSV